MMIPGNHLTLFYVFILPYPRGPFATLSFLLKPLRHPFQALFLAHVLASYFTEKIETVKKTQPAIGTIFIHLQASVPTLLPSCSLDGKSLLLSKADSLLMIAAHPLLSIYGDSSRNCPSSTVVACQCVIITPVLIKRSLDSISLITALFLHCSAPSSSEIPW